MQNDFGLVFLWVYTNYWKVKLLSHCRKSFLIEIQYYKVCYILPNTVLLGICPFFLFAPHRSFTFRLLTIFRFYYQLILVQRTILGCMSPVLIMNSILTLAEHGYGEDHGLATILSTAACIDVVHIISLFTICYSFVFANGMII